MKGIGRRGRSWPSFTVFSRLTLAVWSHVSPLPASCCCYSSYFCAGDGLQPGLEKMLLLAPKWEEADRLSSVEVKGVVEQRVASHSPRKWGPWRNWRRWVGRWRHLLHGAPQGATHEPVGEGKGPAVGKRTSPAIASLDYDAQVRQTDPGP